MFDLGRIADAVGSLAGDILQRGGADGIVQQLGELGVAPSMLQGVDVGQMMQGLSEHGIDLAQLDAGQISDLLAHIGGGQDIASGVAAWLAEQLPRS